MLIRLFCKNIISAYREKGSEPGALQRQAKRTSNYWSAFVSIRDHDDRHLPHPVEMGPQESWNPHPDCGEASGAPGHTGSSVNSVMQMWQKSSQTTEDEKLTGAHCPSQIGWCLLIYALMLDKFIFSEGLFT